MSAEPTRVFRQVVTVEVFAHVDGGVEIPEHLPFGGVEAEAVLRDAIQSNEHGGPGTTWLVAGSVEGGAVEELSVASDKERRPAG